MERICGNCIHYKTGIEPYCRKGNKYFGYLRKMKCYNTGLDTKNLSQHVIKDGVAVKICRGCLQELPLTKFAKAKTTKDGYQGFCYQCFYKKYARKLNGYGDNKQRGK